MEKEDYMSKSKKWFYICSKCNRLLDKDVEIQEDKRKDEGIDMAESPLYLFKCFCGNRIHASDAYPNNSARELLRTCDDIFYSAKDVDKNGIKLIKQIYEMSGLNCDITTLDKYINIYEKIRERHVANDYMELINVMDEFEEVVKDKINLDDVDNFIAAVQMYDKNTYRKLFVITCASYLELVFHDYLKKVVESILPLEGAKRYFKDNDTIGIGKSLDSIDWFLDETFKQKCERISKGFYDRWRTMRELRNDIVHDNKKYISKDRLSKLRNLIDEGTTVFANLTIESNNEYLH